MTNEEMDFIRQSIASHDRQLGELVDRMAETDRKIEIVVAMQKENARQIEENSLQIAENARLSAENSRQIAENSRLSAENSRQIGHNSAEIKLAIDIMVATVGKVALLIEKHERRIQGLEGPITA